MNATIDDLSKQILVRYKCLFSHEMGFREPIKVLLKNDEGFILFGKDLIKDVLNNGCQVQLIVETWKDAPKVHEIYEKNCLKEQQNPIGNNRKKVFNKLIQKEIKLSETSNSSSFGALNLNNYLIDSYHFNLILQSMQINNDYLKLLHTIHLASNLLDDEFSSNFFNFFEKIANLKVLNLSNNQFTAKTLIYFSTSLKKLDNSDKILVNKISNRYANLIF